MSIALSININKIALIRNSREGNNPDLIAYADRCIMAGAQGITVHPRPDQRHIKHDDCYPLKALIEEKRKTPKHSTLEFNIEGNPFAGPEKALRKDFTDYPGFMAILQKARPDQTTFVPDTNKQLTSDHGFDLTQNYDELFDLIQMSKEQGIRVSLFMDPNLKQIDLAKKIGADRIELYTGPFAETFIVDQEQAKASFKRYDQAAKHAVAIGLGVNAGHDLNLENLPLFSQLHGLAEVSIGHALTIDSLEYGLNETIQKYLEALQ